MVCLGDSFDDLHAAHALPEPARLTLARLQAGRLRLGISNHGDTPVPEAAPDPEGGLGLRNLRERLQARYGDAARIEFGPDGAGMALRMELPCAS